MFVLDVDDGWPPVAKECLPCTRVDGGYRIEAAPLFVKDLSAGDVIAVDGRDGEDVVAWSHVEQSWRSTVWLMTFDDYVIEDLLDRLKALGCNVVRFTGERYVSIDVPETCPIEQLDDCLDALDADRSAVAYPSFRHEE